MAFLGIVKLNVMFLVSSIPRLNISFSSLIPKSWLYIIASIWVSILVPRFSTSTMYFTFDPVSPSVGPVIFLITTRLSSFVTVMLIFLVSVSALRLLQIDSLVSSFNLA